MKFGLFFLAAAVMAAPSPDIESRDNEARASCWNRSKCDAFWSGKCEDYCKPYKFSHMARTDCNVFSKRCCCKTK
ncbi:hypothetical protein CDV36_016248 [Fusarium kuroshium]|uniref:Uncharacterized protein n=1 Tax=Fusarium kuroshium TaxID=2010991 RepID=A0A3M2QW14_9HYPO|nr:hypothetical protein CDV36_016248 [Fusarium kuroshium]